MHRRPSGVTFSAVILGIISLFLFLGGVFDVTVAILFARSPGLSLATPSNVAAPPQNLMAGMIGFMAFVTLACAAWGISTFLGLLRMRGWARISVMVIGGCLAGLSLLELFGCIVMQFAMKNMPLPQNTGSTNLVAPNPGALTGAFIFIDTLCVVIAAIGIWWLVYFARRTTRMAFESVPLQATLTSTAQLNPATPITDFSVAQPVEAAKPATLQPVAEVSTVEAAPARPISMIIVAVLLFLGSLSMLFCGLLTGKNSLFFFGTEVPGASKYILLIALAALYALAGFGLLKRMHFGWLLAVGVNILGLLNLLTLLSPNVRERYMAYTQSLLQSTTPATPDASQFSTQILQQMMGPIIGLGTVFILFILVLLWRARWFYKRSE